MCVKVCEFHIIFLFPTSARFNFSQIGFRHQDSCIPWSMTESPWKSPPLEAMAKDFLLSSILCPSLHFRSLNVSRFEIASNCTYYTLFFVEAITVHETYYEMKTSINRTQHNFRIIINHTPAHWVITHVLNLTSLGYWFNFVQKSIHFVTAHMWLKLCSYIQEMEDINPI